MVVTRLNGETMLTVRGPETKAREVRPQGPLPPIANGGCRHASLQRSLSFSKTTTDSSELLAIQIAHIR